jgi:hypothetical protein
MREIIEHSARMKRCDESWEVTNSAEDIMDRLERQFLEMLAKERSKESKRYVLRMSDRLRPSERVREWTQFGWTMHGHFLDYLVINNSPFATNKLLYIMPY